MKQLLVQGLSDLVPEALIWVVESTELKDRVRELVEEARLRFPQALLVSMDPVYVPEAEARIETTRLLDWDTRFEKKPMRILGARPGNLPIALQAQSLSQSGVKRVILADVGVFDGGTFNYVKEELESSGVSVDAFVGAIASPIAPRLHGRATG